jgi:hypothetical protein
MNNPEITEGIPAVLFPYSHFSETEIKKIFTLFGPLRLFSPWYMKPPSLESINVERKIIDVKYPLKEMKPEEKFETLLMEYSRWMHDHQDKGYTEFLKTGLEIGPSENTTWGIRGMLRNMKGGDNTANDTLRWHLILHLAQDMENQRREADRILTSLKEKGILFKGIIDKANDVQNPVEDLPSFESDFFMSEQHLRHIFEAWFALFGVYLRENDLFLTFNRHFMDFADTLWEQPSNENQIDGILSFRFEFPDFSHLSLEDLYEIKRTASTDDTLRGFQDLLLHFGDDPIHNLPKLENLTANLEKSYLFEKTKNTFKIRVKHFPPFPNTANHEQESPSAYLENKTLFLIED